MRPAETYSGQLRRFLWGVLWPAVPRVTWLVLGLAVFSLLNLVFLEELWPHYPLAETWFFGLLGACFFVLPWLGARTAQMVRQRLGPGWWRMLWQLATIVVYGVAGVISLLLCMGILISLMSWGH